MRAVAGELGGALHEKVLSFFFFDSYFLFSFVQRGVGGFLILGYVGLGWELEKCRWNRGRKIYLGSASSGEGEDK
jgi:hypothetical protein